MIKSVVWCFKQLFFIVKTLSGKSTKKKVKSSQILLPRSDYILKKINIQVYVYSGIKENIIYNSKFTVALIILSFSSIERGLLHNTYKGKLPHCIILLLLIKKETPCILI